MTTPATVLVVDDDPDFLQQMRLQLEAAGFQVVTADGRPGADAASPPSATPTWPSST